MGKYFGTDGFRGEAGVDLTADHAYKVGRFLGWYYNALRERNAYYLHEKSFIKGYRFMRIERKDDVTVYKIDWKDLVTILETPVITSIRI